MVRYAIVAFASVAFASPIYISPPYPSQNGTVSNTIPVGGVRPSAGTTPIYTAPPVNPTTVHIQTTTTLIKTTTLSVTATVPVSNTAIPKTSTPLAPTGTIPVSNTATPKTSTPPVPTATPSATNPGGSGIDLSYPSNVPAKGKQCPAALAVNTINDSDGVGPGKDAYRQYSGDGSAASGWPAMNQWVSFKDMWAAQVAIISSSCAQFGQANPSTAELGQIHKAIQIVAQETKVDHRFILAIIMQESKGCPRVWTTNYGVRNPGLMQDHDGAATCNDNDATTKDQSKVKTPCPEATILDMVREGTSGTPKGDGLVGVLEQAQKQAGNKNDAQTYYRAARNYNSGSTAASGSLEAGIATHCYSSDVANRLTGWTNAASGCTFDKGGYA